MERDEGREGGSVFPDGRGWCGRKVGRVDVLPLLYRLETSDYPGAV